MVERFAVSLALAAGVLCFALLAGAGVGSALAWSLSAFALLLLSLFPRGPECDTCGNSLSHLYGNRWTCDRCKREQVGPDFDSE